LPLLQNYDRRLVEVFCYSEVKSPDYQTDKTRMLSDHWRPIMGLTNRAVAEQVRQDGIDILVDLAGHTAENRLLVFACKPAPLQVTWLGYPNTTGMPVIDYRLTDEIADPREEADEYHSETLIRPHDGCLCYGPPGHATGVSGIPEHKNGNITYSAVNNPQKINPQVIGLWSRLLHQVADSRLLLKSKQFADKHVRQRFLDLFSACRIGAERVRLLPRVSSTAGHLAVYHQVDIALDPFPYNGTTTTCEALWMGVPVVTFLGDRHSGRVGASILHAVGIADLLVADSVSSYIEKAAAWANNKGQLKNMRENLRQQMKDSPLCDAVSFTKNVEEAYLNMWKKITRNNVKED